MVVASRATSSPESGTGTLRSSVDPLIESTSARIASTGRRALPARIQVSPAAPTTSNGSTTSNPLTTASTLRSIGSSGEAATSSTTPVVVRTRAVVTSTEPSGSCW